jgi:large subunit ribosomal protein L22
VEVQAKGKNVRIAPRKVRLILNPLKGRRVDEAVAILRNLPMPVARKVEKTVPAAANAENNYNLTRTSCGRSHRRGQGTSCTASGRREAA